jgi:hypothetical protein
MTFLHLILLNTKLNLKIFSNPSPKMIFIFDSQKKYKQISITFQVIIRLFD